MKYKTQFNIGLIISIIILVLINFSCGEKQKTKNSSNKIFNGSYRYVLLLHISSEECPSCLMPLEIIPAFQQQTSDSAFGITFVQSNTDSLLPMVLTSLNLDNYPIIYEDFLSSIGINWKYTLPYYFVYDTHQKKIIIHNPLPKTQNDFNELLKYLVTLNR